MSSSLRNDIEMPLQLRALQNDRSPTHTTFTKRCGASVADVALRPNPTPQGRIELRYNEEWGTVCSAGWSHDAAAKLCQSLGFATGAASRGQHCH
jgi:hypothetical protein